MDTFKFPEGFLWGASTAGHQVEGSNINSDSWLLEHLPGTIFKEPSGDACDHYHRYAEDIRMLADLGLKAYRFSVEWARIEPAEGEFSRASLEHYRRMLEMCLENGIQPMVTLHHMTSPQWLIREGGWLSVKSVDRFARYTERVAEYLGDLAAGVCTFNEPNLARVLEKILPFSVRAQDFWINAASAFGVSPDRLGLFMFVPEPEMWDIIFSAHCKAREILKAGPGNFPVGLSLALVDIQAVDGGEKTAAEFEYELSGSFLERLKDDDFVGVQTYSRMLVGADGLLPPPAGAELNQMGEEFYPESLQGTIRLSHKLAGIPIIVTENGLATEDDTRRVEYYRRALQGVAGCIQDGLDVRGYFAWSAMDNFEWVSGYGPKFGIIEVDRETLKRTPKPSALYLGEVARKNSL